MATRQLGSAAAQGLVDFINRSPSPWHAVAECKKRLLQAGFQELKETERWDIKPLNKYFVTRNMSTIVSFAVGGAYRPGNGFSIVGAHTDSPCPKVKPVSKKENAGYLQVGVELYGGGTWMTWFDRDLKLAGRAMVKAGGKIENRLVHIDRPIMRIPNIAIHLQREINKGFAPNFEVEICPVIGTAVYEQLVGAEGNKPSGEEKTDSPPKHHPILLNLLAEELGVSAADISDFELCLADHQPAAIGGILNEFIFAPRLDNLFNVYTALEAIINTGESLSSDSCIRMASFFDHEEVGSTSAQGANSNFQTFVLQRICGGADNIFQRSIPNSFLISADQAHAVHPNYRSKHEDNHSVQMHMGIVLKFNCNQRYATNAWTAAVLREVASKGDVPLQGEITIGNLRFFHGPNFPPANRPPQIVYMTPRLSMPSTHLYSADFVVRNDSPCGSTIGPMMAAKLAIPTIDIGGAQLSMHSIREQCCTTSVYHAIKLYESFYVNFAAVRDMVVID